MSYERHDIYNSNGVVRNKLCDLSDKLNMNKLVYTQMQRPNRRSLGFFQDSLRGRNSFTHWLTDRKRNIYHIWNIFVITINFIK